MKKINVEICVCTQCVMNGAMDIVEAVEGLKKLISQLKLNIQTQVVTNPCIGEPKHGSKSPLVVIDGEMLENADQETVMSKILACQ